MFYLFRPDVLPVGDLSLRPAVQRAYGLGARPAPAELERIAEPWRRFCSLACVYRRQVTHSTPQV